MGGKLAGTERQKPVIGAMLGLHVDAQRRLQSGQWRQAVGPGDLVAGGAGIVAVGGNPARRLGARRDVGRWTVRAAVPKTVIQRHVPPALDIPPGMGSEYAF